MQDSVYSVLDKCYSNVSDWLKFAEAKNGALIAAGTAAMYAVARIASQAENINLLILIGIWSFYVFMIPAVIIALLSFVPRLYPPYWVKMEEKKDSDNPLYFGHACKYSRRDYLELVAKRYNLGASERGDLAIDLADQVVNNARIAFIKYEMFGQAVWLLLAAVVTPVGAFLIWRLWK